VGKLDLLNWDRTSQGKVRDAVSAHSPLRGNDSGIMFGTRAEVDPVAHLIGRRWDGAEMPASNLGHSGFLLRTR